MTKLEVNFKKKIHNSQDNRASLVGGVVSSALPLWGWLYQCQKLWKCLQHWNNTLFKKILSSFQLFFIVSNHFFLHTEQLLKANITELDSNWNSRHNLCSTIPLFASGYFQGFHILHNPDSSCSIIFKTVTYPNINHAQDIGISILRSIICKTWAYQDFDQLFARFGHIRTLINNLQDLGISGLRSTICNHNPLSNYNEL